MNKALHDFVASIESRQKKTDTKSLIQLMEEASGYKPILSGKIIGYGLYEFKYQNGKEGHRIVTGFSPRKQNLTIYIMNGFSRYKKALEKLGKHKISSKCCLYINKLSDIDENILRTIIEDSVSDITERHELKNS